MSKPNNQKNKNKDKKSQQIIELENKIDALKRQNLEMTVTIRKLSDRTVEMKQLQKIKESSYGHQVKENAIKIQELELVKMAQNQRINAIRQEKQQYEIENGCLKYRIQKINKQFDLDEYKLVQKNQIQQLKKQHILQISKYQTVVNQYQTAINQRLEYIQLNKNLQTQLRELAQEQKKVIADKDRDKLQTIDFLKKQMFEKSKDMRANLLTMRRQQMATNTRLTVLQNHQLLEELQYQSKNTDKILKKNQELEKKVKELAKQLDLQKEIEQELAKRSTIAKKILKNLNEKSIGLQKELQQKQQQIIALNQNKKVEQSLGAGKSMGANELKKQLIQQSSVQKLSSTSNNNSFGLSPQCKESLNQCIKTISILQNEVRNYEVKIKIVQEEKNHFKGLYQQNHPNYQYYLKTQHDLRTLMIRFLNEILDGKVVGQENNVEYDISRLKNKHVDEWSKNDVEITVKMLLTFIKPHFNMKNMKVEYLRYKKYEQFHKDSLDQILKDQRKTQLLYNKSYNNSKHSKIKSLSSTALNSRIIDPKFKESNKTSHVSNEQTNLACKDFSLQNVFNDYKRKASKHKDKKCLSQHYISANSCDKSMNKQGEQIKAGISYKENHNTPQFKPYEFRNKQTKKLIRSSIRDSSKKVQYPSKSSFELAKKLNQ